MDIKKLHEKTGEIVAAQDKVNALKWDLETVKNTPCKAAKMELKISDRCTRNYYMSSEEIIRVLTRLLISAETKLKELTDAFQSNS